MTDSRKRPTKEEVESRMLQRLANFTERLKSGEPIEATLVTQYETPDGPMHTFERVILPPEELFHDPVA